MGKASRSRRPPGRPVSPQAQGLKSRAEPASGAARPPEWRVLAEFNLPAQAGIGELTKTCLSEILGFLKLHPRPLNKMLQVVQEAIARATDSAAADFPMICLRVYLPSNASDKTTPNPDWGFFLMEKAEGGEAGGDNARHLIEFFLYQEN